MTQHLVRCPVLDIHSSFCLWYHAFVMSHNLSNFVFRTRLLLWLCGCCPRFDWCGRHCWRTRTYLGQRLLLLPWRKRLLARQVQIVLQSLSSCPLRLNPLLRLVSLCLIMAFYCALWHVSLCSSASFVCLLTSFQCSPGSSELFRVHVQSELRWRWCNVCPQVAHGNRTWFCGFKDDGKICTRLWKICYEERCGSIGSLQGGTDALSSSSIGYGVYGRYCALPFILPSSHRI